MKKVLFYLLFIIIFIFTIPIIFTKQFKTEEVSTGEYMDKEKIDYGKYSKIRLFHSDSGRVEEIELDNYLYGVVASEMPVSFHIEALKAQAVVARTYTIYQLKNGPKHSNADICDSSLCCQAWMTKENRLSKWDENLRDEYWNKIVKAVDETKCKVILYNKEPINALFHSNSGGKTELAINVWGGNFPYFQTIETVGENEYTSYNSEVEIKKDIFIKKLTEKNSKFQIDFNTTDCIKTLEYTEGGRIKKIKIGNVELSGIDCRQIFGLKSAMFNYEILENTVKFTVLGYGHGVGLSQCGSDVLAKQGKKFDEIIKYYYKDVEISE